MKCVKCKARFESRDDAVDGDYLHECCAKCKSRALKKRKLNERAIDRRTEARAANPNRA